MRTTGLCHSDGVSHANPISLNLLRGSVLMPVAGAGEIEKPFVESTPRYWDFRVKRCQSFLARASIVIAVRIEPLKTLSRRRICVFTEDCEFASRLSRVDPSGNGDARPGRPSWDKTISVAGPSSRAFRPRGKYHSPVRVPKGVAENPVSSMQRRPFQTMPPS